MLRKYKIPVILGALIIIAIVAVAYYTDYLWYQSLNLSQVFLKPILLELLIKSALWLIGFAFILLNVLPLVEQFKVRRLRKIEGLPIPPKQFSISKKILTFIAFGISLFWVWILPQMWDKILLLMNSAPTGQVDPILGRDFSYYLFSYPLYSVLSGILVSLLFLTISFVIAAYIIGGALSFTRFQPKLSAQATIHLSILLGIVLIWYTLTRGLAMAGILVSPSSSLFGAGYTDVHVHLPLLKIQQVLGAILAVVLLVNIRLKKVRILFAAPALLIIVSMLGGVYGGIVEKFVVSPNQMARETPYINHHIQATRDAYGLSAMEEVEYNVDDSEITSDILAENQPTINNIRLLDYRPLQQHYQQNQSLRLYYEFKDIDIDRYRFDEQYNQVMLSMRELNIESLPEQAQTLINRHFKYTHGYGTVMSPVNAITANGHPTYYLRDIPVKSEVNIPLTRPEIYFGEMTDQFVVVGTLNGEFGHPVEGSEVITQYQGEDGVELNAIRRVLYAIKFGKPILLFSDEIIAESRILYNRNIAERIKKAAPFLHLDSNAYPVIADGRIFWIVDAYTVSDLYPYSEPTGGINYLRNSAKVVVDAYNGDINIYKFDENDPIIKAWEGVFPGLIQEREAFPEILENHKRYAVDYFEIQSAMLRNYHMTNPTDFYNRENVWEIPVEKYGGSEIRVEPYYVIMQLPGEDEAEFILKQPFTPLNRNNMVGWLAAGNDGDNYGKLKLFNFPRGQQIEGPSQIEAYIDQDPEISQQISLWDTGGSQVVRGNLLTIPINNSILYVEPLFILSESRSVPELRRIIVFYKDKLVMESSLDLALEKLFGISKVETPTVPSVPGEPSEPAEPGEPIDDNLQDLVTRINQVYLDMETAAREGRWADYGNYGDQLGQMLETLADLVKLQ